jgi:hypothetical protein
LVPGGPALEVVDQRENLFRRRLNGGGAAYLEHVGPRRGIGEHAGDRQDEYAEDDGNDFHGTKLRLESKAAFYAALGIGH